MGKSELSRRKLFLKAWIVLCMLLNAVTPQTSDEGLTSCEIEALVRELANPSQEYQMHAAALRNQLRSLLGKQQIDDYQSIDMDNDYPDSDKRSLGSLARNGFLQNGKRYVGALARSDSLRSQIDAIKRSIATLAKNGQLPSREPDLNDSVQFGEKRNLGSAARSGYLTGKRNVGSLARDFQLPSYGKRNVASLARYGLIPSSSPKRNMASLARMSALPQYKRGGSNDYWYDDLNSDEMTKRNIGSLKNSPTHGQREKRDLGDNIDIVDPVLQNPPLDYEELKDMLSHVYNLYYGGNTHEEKRFLGSVARSGWFQYRPIEKRNLESLARSGLLHDDYSDYGSANDRDSFRQQEQKRHIGSVARSGWLPAFRPIRSGRFSRSGRARSRIVEYYPQQERLRQPIAAVCRRCDDTRNQNAISWGAPGLQTSWGTPPRLTALHWRSLRRTEPFY